MLSRRQLLRRAGLLASGGAALVALAACGSTSPAGVAATSGTTGSAAPAASAATTTASGQTSSTATSTASGKATTSAPAAAPAGNARATTLQITYFGGTNVGVDYFAQNAKAFAAKHPGITVQAEPGGGNDYDQKVLSLVASGTPPDVILQGGRDFGLFVTKGVLLDLSPLIARDHFDSSDFFPVCMQLTTWQNKVYGLPDDFNVFGLYYDRDILRKAGVDTPPTDWKAGGWTWNDFVEAAKKLTVSSGGTTTQFGTDMSPANTTDFAPILWSYGGDYVDKQWTKCLMDQPPAIEALQFAQDVATKDKIIPTAADLKKQSGNIWYTGKVGYHPAGAFNANPSAQNIKSFTWDAGVLPAGPKGRFSVTGGTQGASWSVVASGKQKDDAWQLTQGMTSPEAMTVLCEAGWIGARKSIAYSKAYLDPAKLPAHRQVFLDATEHAGVVPLLPNWTDVNKAIGKGLGDLITGNKSPQDVGSEIVQAVNPLLQQLQQK